MPVPLCHITDIIDSDLADRYRTPVAANIAIIDAVVDQADEIQDNGNGYDNE
jgi:hypothetical protein